MRRVLVRSYGLTLVEVLVALAILGVVSAAVVSSFGALVTINRMSQADARLVSGARSAVEGLRSWLADPANAVPSDAAEAVVRVNQVFEWPALADGVDCEATAVSWSVAATMIRASIECSAVGASQPGAFTFDVMRDDP